MPTIKDKYKGKGPQIRSKYQRELETGLVYSNLISTEQKNEISKQEYRSNPENKTQVGGSQSNLIKFNNLNYFNFTTTAETNTLINLFALEAGDKLNSITIYNYNASNVAATVSLYWSFGDQSLLTSTATGGVVTTSKGAVLVGVFASAIPYLATADLHDFLSNTFNNTNKKIYFYTASSHAGPSISYNITSG